MGRLYNINSFSPLYLDLINTVHERTRVEVEHPSSTAAQRARFVFYDLKKALRQAPEPHLQTLSLMAEQIAVTISGNVITFQLRDHEPETAALARALRNAGSLPHATPDEISNEIDALLSKSATKTQDDLLADFLTKPQKSIDSGSND